MGKRNTFVTSFGAKWKQKFFVGDKFLPLAPPLITTRLVGGVWYRQRYYLKFSWGSEAAYTMLYDAMD